MATETRALRLKARGLGIANVRELSRSELKAAIEDVESNGSRSSKSARKAVKKATTAKASKTRRGPGRPKGSTTKAKRSPAASAAKRSTSARRGPGRPRKSESEAPARPAKRSNRRSNGVGRPVGSGTGERVAVPDKINFNREFSFRDGSTAQYILEQLQKSAKKYKDTADIREDTFDRLVDKVGEVDELTFTNRSTGRPHKGERAEQMLRYRINRTIFDFAVNTGQHEGSGESDYSKPRNGGSVTPKRRGRPPKAESTVKRGRGRPRKVVEDDEDEEETPRPRRGRPPKRRGPGRPKGSTNKATTAKAKRGPGRPPGKRGPGRPKGSKNRR